MNILRSPNLDRSPGFSQKMALGLAGLALVASGCGQEQVSLEHRESVGCALQADRSGTLWGFAADKAPSSVHLGHFVGELLDHPLNDFGEDNRRVVDGETYFVEDNDLCSKLGYN